VHWYRDSAEQKAVYIETYHAATAAARNLYKPVNAAPSEVNVRRPMGLSMQQKLTNVSGFMVWLLRRCTALCPRP